MTDTDPDRSTIEESSRPLPLAPLIAITAAMAISMTIEYLPGGLLPLMGEEFDVSYSQLGLLISVFAGVVVVTALPIGWVTQRASRKGLLLTALGLIAISSALVAVVPTFESVLAARALGGAAHGLFFSIAAAYVAQLVPREQLGRAISMTALGGTIATIAGTPIGNLLGQLLGWRVSFGVMGIVAAMSLVAALLLVPSVAHLRNRATLARPTPTPASTPTPRHDGQVDPSRRPVLAIAVVLALVIASATSFGTYSVAWYLGPGDFEALMIPPMLLISALVGAGGLALTARFSDRYPTTVLTVASAGLVLSFVALPAVSGVTAVVLLSLLFGLCWGTVPTLLQATTMRVSSDENRTFAGAVQVTAINVGVGAGAIIGGQVIHWVGLELLPLVSGLMLFVGAAAAVLLDRRLRRAGPVVLSATKLGGMR